MLNLFDITTYAEIIERVNKLTPDVPSKWGKMNVAQMLSHCNKAFIIPLSEKQIPRMFIGRLLGPLIKSKLYNDSPWKQNLPTAPMLITREQCDFNKEKQELINLINRFYAAGPMGISKFPHPMFGKFTGEQWGKSMYKHLDHHLLQFGV